MGLQALRSILMEQMELEHLPMKKKKKKKKKQRPGAKVEVKAGAPWRRIRGFEIGCEELNRL